MQKSEVALRKSVMTDCPEAVRHKEDQVQTRSCSKQPAEADDSAGPLPESAVQVVYMCHISYTTDCVKTLTTPIECRPNNPDLIGNMKH